MGTLENRRWPGRAPLMIILLSFFSSLYGTGLMGEEAKVGLLVPDGMVFAPQFDASPSPGFQVALMGWTPSNWSVYIDGQNAEYVYKPRSSTIFHWKNLTVSIQSFARETHGLYIDNGLLSNLFEDQNIDLFFHEIQFDGPVKEVEIIAEHPNGIMADTATFYYDPDTERTYLISVDDVIRIFKEINDHKEGYHSIFEHPIMGFLRTMHQEHGAKFLLFLFFERTRPPEFDLSRMTDQYKNEWIQNADWLRLGFHASRELPGYPYAQASYEQAAEDLSNVREEVYRFAGTEVWEDMIRSHGWSGSIAACRAWRDTGVRGLYASVPGFRSYYLSPVLEQLLHRHDRWRDHMEDILFLQSDVWIEGQVFPPKSIIAILDSLYKAPYGHQRLHLFTHEQQLRRDMEFLEAGLDIKYTAIRRIEQALAWLSERQYTAQFDSDSPFLSVLPPVPPNHVQASHRGAYDILLTWQHPRYADPYRYAVYRKEAHQAWLVPWGKIGVSQQTTFVDTTYDPSERYLYAIATIDPKGAEGPRSHPVVVRSPVSMDIDTGISFVTPTTAALSQNQPNPFNTETHISYYVSHPGHVQLLIYTILGQAIKQFDQNANRIGIYYLTWDGKDEIGSKVASGVYLYRLVTGNGFHQTRKMMVLR